MRGEQIRLWELQRGLAEQKPLLPLLLAGEFDQAKQKLDDTAPRMAGLKIADREKPFGVASFSQLGRKP